MTDQRFRQAMLALSGVPADARELTGPQFAEIVLVLQALGREMGEPPLREAPCWAAATAFDDAGADLPDSDPLAEAADWEWLAWAAERCLPRGPVAVEFAALCRGFADDCMGGLAA